MTTPTASVRFPNESDHYRQARNALLNEETALRRQIERVAAQRRALPLGGIVPENYTFERLGPAGPESVRMTELFGPGKNSLALYSFQFGPDREKPCAGCVQFLDGLDGVAPHIYKRTNLYVVGGSSVTRLKAFALQRGWRNLRLLSTGGNTYSRDYFGQAPQERDNKTTDMPMLNVFVRDGQNVRHFWGSELLYAPVDAAQDARHNDLLSPLWNLFDMLPEGRGDFQPQLSYAA